MILYFAVGVVSMVVMSMPLSSKNGYGIKLAICFILLFILGAFRYDFGLDYFAYEEYYNYVTASEGFIHDQSDRMEIGYSYLNYLCPSYRFLLIATSALVCVAYYALFKRYIPQKYGLFAIFLFYLSGNNTIIFMYSGIRNAIAISLLILSIPLIEKKKLIYYAGMTALAWSFHNSALIIFPIAYLFGYIKEITSKVANWMIIVAIGLFLIPYNFLISTSAQFVLANFDRYTSYIEHADEIGKGASMLVSLSNILIIAITGYGLSKLKLGHQKSLVVLLGLLACYFPLLGSLDLRLSIYFGGILIPAVVIAYSAIRDKVLKYSILGIVIAYKAYAFFVVWLNNPYFAFSQIHNYVFDIFKI